MSIYNPGFSLEHFDSKVGGAKKRRSSKRKSKKSLHSASKHGKKHAMGGAKKRRSSKRKSKKSQHRMLPF